MPNVKTGKLRTKWSFWKLFKSYEDKISNSDCLLNSKRKQNVKGMVEKTSSHFRLVQVRESLPSL